MYNKEGFEIDSCPFIFNVSLDELETHNNVKLMLKPYDPSVIIARYPYKKGGKIDPFKFIRAECYETDFFYNNEDDEIILNVLNGFDVAIFNICSLLNIGKIEIDKGVPYRENGFAPVHDKVSRIKLTLEEFKQLDGFVAVFKFVPYFILFKGLLIGANYIHEDVHDGDVVPNFKSDNLLRGEKLFKLD